MKLMYPKQIDKKYLGIVKASKEIFEETLEWDVDNKPVFDVLDEFKPDVVYCDLERFSNTLSVALEEYNHIKLVLFSNIVPLNANPALICASPSLSPLMKKHLQAGRNVIYLKDAANILGKTQEANPQIESDVCYVSTEDKGNGYLEEILL